MPPGQMRQNPMPIRKFHPEEFLPENFHYPAFNFDSVLAGHVKISGSDSVMSTVCSKWADN